MAASLLRLGLLSDTHGLLRPEARAALADRDVLLHAGDVGSEQCLHDLRTWGCEHFVRGNVDRAGWASGLPLKVELVLGELQVVMVHDRADLEPADDLVARGVHLALFGHSHRPSVERHGDLYLVNPGSCGPRRFSLPVTVARAAVDGESGEWIEPPEIVELDV